MSDLLAYVGLGLALLSYAAGTRGYVNFDSRLYQISQLVACLFAGGAAVLMGFVPYIAFNAVWATIALVKLYRLST